ncbi:hypothetical protein G6O69_02330 [Pseudenhygromyxa sp. WMMC2535]|uniref:hypothetical protein n=1 Tax=Pseudenhygromyxa sp. WMMC2535 TaxID=2712867 RepID=UPI0015951A1F|nr:hypothetical protein [Pseudenhygromyxa sp. WMMC2535]NVB36651.1 hypothetical protein [Pseudenhygromyxa sp. WMMC2535]
MPIFGDLDQGLGALTAGALLGELLLELGDLLIAGVGLRLGAALLRLEGREFTEFAGLPPAR